MKVDMLIANTSIKSFETVVCTPYRFSTRLKRLVKKNFLELDLKISDELSAKTAGEIVKTIVQHLFATGAEISPKNFSIPSIQSLCLNTMVPNR